MSDNIRRVKERGFNRINVDSKRNLLRKESRYTQKLINEIKWYLNLPPKLSYLTPKIIDYSLNQSKPFVVMKYYPWPTLHNALLENWKADIWRKIFISLKKILEDFSSQKYPANVATIQKIYIDKTLNRLSKIKNDKNFKNLFEIPIIINGNSFLPLNAICNIIKEKAPYILKNEKNFSIIHGDLCFPNILVNPKNFSELKLIDPRGSFDFDGIYGDNRYDIAKLLHSVEGKYDFLIEDMFLLKKLSENEFVFKFKATSNIAVTKTFYEVFPVIGNDSLRLIEALLFLSMVPLHYDFLERQYAMLCRGILLLNDIIDIRC